MKVLRHDWAADREGTKLVRCKRCKALYSTTKAEEECTKVLTTRYGEFWYGRK